MLIKELDIRISRFSHRSHYENLPKLIWDDSESSNKNYRNRCTWKNDRLTYAEKRFRRFKNLLFGSCLKRYIKFDIVIRLDVYVIKQVYVDHRVFAEQREER